MIESAPGVSARPGSTSDDLLVLDELVKYFPIRAGLLGGTVGHVHAVDGVSFSLRRGEAFGLVGESGCGKSTLAQTVIRLYRPDSGRIVFEGTDLSQMSARAL